MATDTSKYKLNRIEHFLFARMFLTVHRFDAPSERSGKVRYRASSPKESLRKLWYCFEWNTMSFGAWNKFKSSLSQRTNLIYTSLPMMDQEARLTALIGQTGKASSNWRIITAPKKTIPSRSPTEIPILERASAMCPSALTISRQHVKGLRMQDIHSTRSNQRVTQEIPPSLWIQMATG